MTRVAETFERNTRAAAPLYSMPTCASALHPIRGRRLYHPIPLHPILGPLLQYHCIQYAGGGALHPIPLHPILGRRASAFNTTASNTSVCIQACASRFCVSTSNHAASNTREEILDADTQTLDALRPQECSTSRFTLSGFSSVLTGAAFLLLPLSSSTRTSDTASRKIPRGTGGCAPSASHPHTQFR